MTHDEIKSMLEKISPWPWFSEPGKIVSKDRNMAIYLEGGNSDEEEEFIVAAPTIVSQLLAENEALQAKLEVASKTLISLRHDIFHGGPDEINKLMDDTLEAIK